MALDFPATPAIGSRFTSPSGSTWQWDGAKWLAVAGGAGSRSDTNVGRNFLHNGSIQINQRGAGPWTGLSGAYTSDRWMMLYGGDTMSVSIVGLSDADKAAIGDEAPANFLQAVFAGSAAANSASTLAQRIELARRLSNKAVTASFVAKATSGTPRLGVSALQVFGTGGSPSPQVVAPLGATPALTANATRYALSAPLPSTAGKSWGTNGNDYTQLTFVCSDVSNSYGTGVGQQSGTVQITDLQLEIVDAVTTPPTFTAFERIGPEQDLARCQRFYCTGSAQLNTYNAAGASCAYMTALPGIMRTTPTIVPSFGSGLNSQTGSMVAASGSVVQFAFLATAAGPTQANATFTASADL